MRHQNPTEYKDSPETREKKRLAKLGSKNPMWKGNEASKASARQRARRLIPLISDLEIHHIDGNPLNNDPLNLLPSTRRQHMETDGRLEKLKARNRIPPTEETRRKMSKSQKGRKHTQESKQLMSEAHKGHYPTETTRQKLSKARRLWWMRRKGLTLTPSNDTS